ncbi:hypothetical protein J8L70_00025 [Pseudoalteromonas sp. MMG010]|uniref:hypothetical protein n=1 Tax=Pseudoalteromonas sp. MMG010 TaxID=2822685 RepID=UPI001B3A44DB|nr:hypothetical protein [Pseudoalteromonas sp. MMG010]MBQ4831629.1 hypothetical protein [Pseudoalteromonas sp. MMG010]
MSTKEILFVLILIFVCGFISSQLAELSIPQYAVPFMAMVGGFIAVALNRLKHLDDLNLTRKKDAALEYIKYFSEYRSALLNLIDPSVKDDLFHSNLMDATKNMVASLDKFHVVSSDSVSEKIEIKNAEVIKLMMDFRAKSTEFSEDKKSLLRWFIDEDIGSKLNTIRHEIITLINTEVGDGSGTTKLKSAIDSNNADFKSLFSKLLK